MTPASKCSTCGRGPLLVVLVNGERREACCFAGCPGHEPIQLPLPERNPPIRAPEGGGS